jgi:hypothetical protein
MIRLMMLPLGDLLCVEIILIDNKIDDKMNDKIDDKIYCMWKLF